MQDLIALVQFLILHGPEILAAIVSILTGVIAIALFIPGDEPEATLKKVVAFLEKHSKKKPE